MTKAVSPTDTLFVFARAAEGPRMPVAILRAQAKDLPLEFTLDDRSSMMGAKLSEQKSVIVGARISRSGNATPQPGEIALSLERLQGVEEIDQACRDSIRVNNIVDGVGRAINRQAVNGQCRILPHLGFGIFKASYRCIKGKT